MAPVDSPTLMVPEEATNAVAHMVVLDGGRRTLLVQDVEDATQDEGGAEKSCVEQALSPQEGTIMDGHGGEKSIVDHIVNVSDGKFKKAISQNFMDATDDVATYLPDAEEEDGSPKEPGYVQKSCFILHFIHCFFMCFGCRPLIDRCRQCLFVKRIAAWLCCPAFCMMQLLGRCKAFSFKCPCRTCFAHCGNAIKACCTKCIAGCYAPWINCKGCFLSLPCIGRFPNFIAACGKHVCSSSCLKCPVSLGARCKTCFLCLKLRQLLHKLFCCCSLSCLRSYFASRCGGDSAPGCVCIFPSTMCGCGCACPKCRCSGCGCISPCMVMTPGEKAYWEEHADKGLLYTVLGPCRCLAYVVRMLMQISMSAVRELSRIGCLLAHCPCSSICKSSPSTAEDDLEQQADLTPTSIVPCSPQTGITVAAFDTDPVKQLVMENVITVSGTPVVMPVATCEDAADEFDTEAIAEAA